MFEVLLDEMSKRNITAADLSRLLHLSERSIQRRIDRLVEFQWMEVRKIRNTYFPEKSIAYLFRDSGKRSCQCGDAACGRVC